MQPHNSHDGNLRDLCDGSYLCSHPLFSNNPQSIQLLLYFDDFTTVNPIGHQVKQYKFSAFYFTLGNIEPQYRSKLHAMQLALLADAKLIKDYGFASVLSPLLRDLKVLEETGISITKDDKEFVFKGSLAVVLADNLASHGIGGLMESFTAFRSCRFCMANKSEMQTSVDITAFQSRTPASFDAQCASVTAFPELASTYGVKRTCCLNDLTYFHAADGLPSDVVHDLFEGGFVCVVLENFIEQCIRLGYFTLESLTRQISEFNYQSTDKANCPSVISRVSGSVQVSQKAVQVWCLMRLMPLFVGDRIPVSDLVWEVLLRLADVVERSLAKTLSAAQAVFLGDLIEEFLNLFHNQFPDKPFKPKAHFILHYPAQILKFGPLVHLWTMRFEGKHSFFKEAAIRTKCYKNLCLSLAVRHQYHQALHHHSANFLYTQERNTSGGMVMPVCLLQQSVQTLIEPLLSADDNLYQCSSVLVDGFRYGCDCAVVTGFVDDEPQFKCVRNGFIINSKIYLLCSDLWTLGYDRHYHAYAVTHLTSFSLLQPDDLIDRHPLGLYRHNTDLFVVLHHRVFFDHHTNAEDHS